MKYSNVSKGVFISRPNRFIADVDIDGERKICHVKNTGRCRELLVRGTRVVLEKTDSAKRKTKYDLIAVYKKDELINIDSQAPNKVFGEWVRNSDYFKNVSLIQPEYTYKNSRFDFYIEADGRKIFVEVKGVTLEENGIVMFPDAPTERGVKHMNELIDAKENGYDTYVFFVIQMKNCKYFVPNEETHPEFAKALRKAIAHDVNVCAVNCNVKEDELKIDGFVSVIL